jgi:hypothetical protein
VLDWNLVRNAFSLAVSAATGIVPESIAWVNTSDAGTWQAFPYVEIKLRSVRRLGDDSEVYSVSEDALVTTMVGPREAIVEVRITSDNQDEAEAVGVVAERLRTRIQRASVLEILSNSGIGLGSLRPSVEADFRGESGRMLSVSVTEVALNLIQVDVDETASADFVEHVTYKAETIKKENGADSPIQPLITVPPIP